MSHTFLKQECLLSPATSFRVTCHATIEYQYTIALIPFTPKVPVSLVSPASCPSHNLKSYFLSPSHHTVSLYNAVAKTALVKFKGCTWHVAVLALVCRRSLPDSPNTAHVRAPPVILPAPVPVSVTVFGAVTKLLTTLERMCLSQLTQP